MKTTTVTPAYGRNYKSAKAALADWNANKDFIVADNFDLYDGKPANKEQVSDRHILIRYGGLRKIVRAQ